MNDELTAVIADALGDCIRDAVDEYDRDPDESGPLAHQRSGAKDVLSALTAAGYVIIKNP